jgi:hypothetical protein
MQNCAEPFRLADLLTLLFRIESGQAGLAHAKLNVGMSWISVIAARQFRLGVVNQLAHNGDYGVVQREKHLVFAFFLVSPIRLASA